MLFACLVLTGLLISPQLLNIHVQIDLMEISQDLQQNQLRILDFPYL